MSLVLKPLLSCWAITLPLQGPEACAAVWVQSVSAEVAIVAAVRVASRTPRARRHFSVFIIFTCTFLRASVLCLVRGQVEDDRGSAGAGRVAHVQLGVEGA